MHSKAKENIASAQEKQKKQYDAKHDALKVNCEFHTQTAHLCLKYSWRICVNVSINSCIYYRSFQLAPWLCSRTWLIRIVCGGKWIVHGRAHTPSRRLLGRADTN